MGKVVANLNVFTNQPANEWIKLERQKFVSWKLAQPFFADPLKNFSSLGLYWSTILNNIWRELPNAKVHQISISKPKLQWRGIEREIFEFKAEAFTAEPPRR